ncbi:MAG: tetratricopeptide repeat protein [Endomicrobiia bacterium]|jgi:tetratricopeptide (TPR) repeat protein|nr:tetratricopeptide repeat protein [Endomicrobiaceae bacterium]MDD3053217.1 tetratricopeptide repeat protein [Endomicrobiaceae bacterium]MDD3923127.1 tetratricopeptide repeat protein [Endomicrobiaceae bacterium]MDD5101936.1 tetratricopeptide repeat protein [Endomicrobiaceae bacterium]
MDIKEQEELLEMAKFYFLNSKFDEAIIEFKKVLKINPLNADVYCNLGLIYENRKQQSEAKKMYEKCLGIDKNNKVARDHINKLIGFNDEQD